MICLLALIVFGILGIFSATNRRIAREAFDCVFRKITLRKCQTGLDSRLKGQVTGRLLRRWPRIGKFVYRYFEIISWAFTILLLVSLVYTGIAGYNYYRYGNCNGPNSGSFCIFDPTGANDAVSHMASDTCASPAQMNAALNMDSLNLSLFPTLHPDAKNTVVFIGCYECPYTRELYPTMRALSERADVKMVFAHYPINNDSRNLTDAANCIADHGVDKLWEFNDKVFKADPRKEDVDAIIASLNLSVSGIHACMKSPAEQARKDAQLASLNTTGIYGTPLVFVNGQPLVGPKPARVYGQFLR